MVVTRRLEQRWALSAVRSGHSTALGAWLASYTTRTHAAQLARAYDFTDWHAIVESVGCLSEAGAGYGGKHH